MFTYGMIIKLMGYAKLSDIMGFVKTMGKLEEFDHNDQNKSYLRMTISDLEYDFLIISIFLHCFYALDS